MNHRLKKQQVDGVIWWQCEDCGATYKDKHWWIGGFKSKEEPECSCDNLDWERNAEKGDLPWN